MNNTIKVSGFIVIESQILLDTRLTNTEKILYSYISALSSNKDNQCFATSDYLGHLLQVDSRHIRRMLAKLKKLNYIDVKIEGNRRFIKSKIVSFMEYRNNKNIDLFDYDWLNDNNSEN